MVTNIKKAILFANGKLPLPEHFVNLIASKDYLVAVDGGLGHMTSLGLIPDLIIGDLDSANTDDVEQYRTQGVEVRKYPEDKDETDLEIALMVVQEMNPEVIWITAAFGGRLDQTLANIFLLTHPGFAGSDIRLVDSLREVFLIRKSVSITGKPGQRVSLLPLNGPATGIQTTGLKYALINETLYPEKTRGISNLMTATSATVTFQNGLLLCIHQITEPDQRSDLNNET